MRLRNKLRNQLGLVLVLAVGLAGGAITATAADNDKKKKEFDTSKKNAWIKICEDVKVKEVKEKKAEQKQICMTHHESLSAKTGAPLISAAVRKVSGHKKEKFLVTVPLGMAIPSGVHIKVDENEPLKFRYAFCHVAGCVAEMVMTDALMKQLKTGKKLVVATVSISGKPVGFPVPLGGFDKAYTGKPIDGKKYANARKQMMLEIRKRQIELAKKREAEKLKKADKGKEKEKK